MTSLEQLETWIQKLCDLLWRNLRQLQNIEPRHIYNDAPKPIPPTQPTIIEPKKQSNTSPSSGTTVNGQVLSKISHPITQTNPVNLNNHYSIRLKQHKQNYVTFLALLVERSLVIEKQPPQVLMKDKRFVATLRHLGLWVEYKYQ